MAPDPASNGFLFARLEPVLLALSVLRSGFCCEEVRFMVYPLHTRTTVVSDTSVSSLVQSFVFCAVDIASSDLAVGSVLPEVVLVTCSVRDRG